MSILKLGGLAVSLAVCMALVAAGSASAVITINPPGTAVTGSSTNTTFTSPLGTVACPTAAANGTTSNPASDTVNLPTVTFTGNCTGPVFSTPIVSTTANAATPWRLIALTKDTTGKVLSGGVICIPSNVATPAAATLLTFPAVAAPFTSATIAAGKCGANPAAGNAVIGIRFGGGAVVCTLTVGPQLVKGTFSEATTVLTVNDATVNYISSGGVCGASAKATFTGDYNLSPNTITVTNP